MVARKDRILDVEVDTKKMNNLQNKLSKYPPFAIQEGLRAAEEYLNNDQFKLSMYPEESDEPFLWSSDKQRKAYFASDGFGKGIPYQRTYELMRSGTFAVNAGYLTVEYTNTAPYSNYVINPSMQIIGHKRRGWQPINQFVVAQSKNIARVFQTAARAAWEKLTGSESFDYVRRRAGK